MLISIVTPAFRAETHLPATLASVLAQTHEDWEHIVVDDGSPDNTAELVQRFSQQDSRIRLQRQPNAGVAAARNAGYRLISARSDFVIFLDADDLWRTNCLAVLARTLHAHGAAPAAHGRAECIDAGGNAIPMAGYERLGRRFMSSVGIKTLADDQPTDFASLALLDPITTPGQVLIRRSALERAGLFDGVASPAEDWDLWLRLALQAPFAYVPETVLDYRRHGGNASSALPRMRRGELYVRNKAMAATTSRPAEHAAARGGLRHAELTRCAERLELARLQYRHRNWTEAARDLARASTSLIGYARSFLL